MDPPAWRGSMTTDELPASIPFPPPMGAISTKIGPFTLSQALVIFLGAGTGGALAMVLTSLFPSPVTLLVSLVLFSAAVVVSLLVTLLKREGLPLWRYHLLRWRFSRKERHLAGREAARIVDMVNMTKDTVTLEGDVFVRGVEVRGVNLGLLTEEGRREYMAAFLSALHALDFPVEVVARPVPFDPRPFLRRLGDREGKEEDPLVKVQMYEYASFLTGLTRETLVRRFFVFTAVNLPASDRDIYRNRRPTQEEKSRSAGNLLDRRIGTLVDELTNAGLETETISGEPLIELLKDYYRWGKKSFTPERLRECFAPGQVHLEKDHAIIGDECLRVLKVDSFPASLPPGFLSHMLVLQEKVDVVLHIDPLPQDAALEMLAKEISSLKVEHISRNKKGASNLAEIEHSLSYFEALREALVRREDALYESSLLFALRARNLPELETLTATLQSSMRALMLKASIPIFETDEALKAVLPLCRDRTGEGHLLPGSCLAAMYPFTTSVLVHEEGVLCGLSEESGAPVIFDRYSMENYNSCILGTSGSGKSYMAKLEILRQVMCVEKLRAFILDPLGEFGDLTRALGGTSLAFGPGEETHLNPLWVGTNRTERVRLALEFLSALMDIDQEEASILDSALHALYLERQDEVVLGDLLAKIRSVQVPAAARLATLLERAVSGSLSWLNHATDMDLAGRLVTFDIRGVDKTLFAPMMGLVLGYVSMECARNMEKKLVVVDEAWYLMEKETTARALANATRHFRHYHTGLTLISQTAEDFLGSEQGRVVLSNTSMIALVRHKNVTPDMKEYFSLTPAEVSFVKHARTGKDVGYSTALLVTGNAHTPVRIVSSEGEHIMVTTNPEELLRRQRFGDVEVTT
jgi:hypothetical protein